jgi:hypothetical protein
VKTKMKKIITATLVAGLACGAMGDTLSKEIVWYEGNTNKEYAIATMELEYVVNIVNDKQDKYHFKLMDDGKCFIRHPNAKFEMHRSQKVAIQTHKFLTITDKRTDRKFNSLVLVVAERKKVGAIYGMKRSCGVINNTFYSFGNVPLDVRMQEDEVLEYFGDFTFAYFQYKNNSSDYTRKNLNEEFKENPLLQSK